MEAVAKCSNLVLPKGFVELDREEMTYVDGGAQFIVHKVWWIPYAYQIKLSNYETNKLTNLISIGAGIACIAASLAAMGVITAFGSAPAYLLSGILWVLGEGIDYINQGNGVSIYFLNNGWSTVWAN